MYATFKFDTEDVYYPPEFPIDDIPGWLAEIMTDVGIRGTFCVFGEKARSLKDRGRKDVLAKMAEHDLVSHQQGNVRPLIPEILEDKGWADGVAAMREYEDQVAEDFRAAFGKEPLGLSRHNLYFAAQHVAVAGERRLPYMTGVLGAAETEQPTWYAGALMIPSTSTPGFGGFDHIYSNDDAFEARLKQMDAYVAGCLARGVEYVSLFGCHPVQVMAHGWLEHYTMASGAAKTPDEVGWLYAVKTPDEEARAKANFRRLVEYMKNHEGLEMVGVSEAARLFSAQPEDIRRDELADYAARLLHARKPILHRTFSPAEMVCGFAESLVHAAEHGDLPYAVARRDVLGPTTRPAVAPEVDGLTHDELIALCRQVTKAAAGEGHLPGNATVAGGRVGIGQFALLAGRAYLAQAGYEKYEVLRVPVAPRYPDEALAVDAWARRSLGEHWPYSLDFSCEKIAEHLRLQTWTLKPAWLRPPRGTIRGEARVSL
jgi:hypothetical protein